MSPARHRDCNSAGRIPAAAVGRVVVTSPRAGETSNTNSDISPAAATAQALVTKSARRKVMTASPTFASGFYCAAVPGAR